MTPVFERGEHSATTVIGLRNLRKDKIIMNIRKFGYGNGK
jgi:hypothetical protein